MIKLRVSRNLLIGVDADETLPKEGDGMVKYIENRLDEAAQEFVDAYDVDQVRVTLKAAVKSHFSLFGKWPTYFASKFVVTHDPKAHKRNVRKFDDLTAEKWNQL